MMFPKVIFDPVYKLIDISKGSNNGLYFLNDNKIRLLTFAEDQKLESTQSHKRAPGNNKLQTFFVFS